MKNFFTIIVLLLLLSCADMKDKPIEHYKITQEVYSNQGIDSIHTQTFYSESGFIFKSIYSSKDPIDLKDVKYEEADKFIETHKEYNKPF